MRRLLLLQLIVLFTFNIHCISTATSCHDQLFEHCNHQLQCSKTNTHCYHIRMHKYVMISSHGSLPKPNDFLHMHDHNQLRVNIKLEKIMLLSLYLFNGAYVSDSSKLIMCA